MFRSTQLQFDCAPSLTTPVSFAARAIIAAILVIIN